MSNIQHGMINIQGKDHISLRLTETVRPTRFAKDIRMAVASPI